MRAGREGLVSASGLSKRHAPFVIWNKICKSGMAFSVFLERKVTQQLLFVTVSKVIPFNSWQEIQRGAERREGRGMAYGKWNDSSDQNKLFLVSLGPDPIIRLSVRSDNCWSGDSPDGRERDREKKDHLETVCTHVKSLFQILNADLYACPCVRVCILWRAGGLKVRSKAAVLAVGGGHHYLWVADMREKWNPLSDPNDVFFWSEKSKHAHCSVTWPSVGSQSGHCRKRLVFQWLEPETTHSLGWSVKKLHALGR